MSEIIIGTSYLEPTQWCVDVFIDGAKTQLTWSLMPRECPTQEEINIAVAHLLEILNTPIIIPEDVT